MRKLVILFPEVEFLTCSDPKIIDKYINCILKRYSSKGYFINIVNYKNSQGFYTLLNKKLIDSGIAFYSKEAINPDFSKTINELNISKNDEIVVCGFHRNYEVLKLANEIYRINKNVIIDSDLTEYFPDVIRERNFNVEKFNPNNKIKALLEDIIEDPTLHFEKSQQLLKVYQSPVWGISKRYIKKIKYENNEF